MKKNILGLWRLVDFEIASQNEKWHSQVKHDHARVDLVAFLF